MAKYAPISLHVDAGDWGVFYLNMKKDVVEMGFVESHAGWLQDHLRRRRGERRDRLRRGHGHGEKLFLKLVWWPLFGHLQGLHPEYEVVDWRGRSFFVDLMWRMGNIKIAFEIKGFGPHVEQADRTSYRRELNRELFLQGMGIRVVSIPYDELAENHELIKTLVRIIVSPYLEESNELEAAKYSRVEKELIQLAFKLDRVIKPVDAVRELQLDYKTVVKYLRRLCEKGKFKGVESKTGKVVRYEYVGSFLTRS